MTKKALIFTKKVLPRSNTFVAAQGLNLLNTEPIFIGFKRDNSGIELIKGKQVCIQEDYQRFSLFPGLLLEKFGYLSQNWKSALIALKPDLIHAHFGKSGFYSSIIAKQLNLPLIVTFHGSDITQQDKLSYNQKHRETIFNQARIIIAASKFIEKKLILRGCPEDKLIQLYIGVDLQFFSPKSTKASAPAILFVGRLITQKGCAYLLEAMKTINKKLPKAQLIIAGDGRERASLEIQSQRLTNVSFVGARNKEQVRDLMDNAWVMCAPSIVMKRGNEEGLGMVYLEAQAMGTPVVGFNTGGVKEAVIHKKTGFLVKEKDISALANSILTLLESKETHSTFAKAAIQHVNKKFNLVEQNAKLENIYHQVIQTNT